MWSTLIPRIRALPPTAAVGLWTFDGVEGRSEVSAGPLADPVDGKPRSEALTTTLDAHRHRRAGRSRLPAALGLQRGEG